MQFNDSPFQDQPSKVQQETGRAGEWLRTKSEADPPPEAFRIEALVQEDVPPMLELFSRSIPHSQLGRSIYLAHGVGRYLSGLLQHTGFHRHEQLWGLKTTSGRLLAAAHCRVSPGISHLNNCAVDPSIQNLGLGSRLMDHWERTAQESGIGRLTLDVADENASAQRLYFRRGFKVAAVTHEYKLLEPFPSAATTDPVLHCWPQAVASYETFGFGRFCLEWGAQRHKVDLFKDCFRISSPEERLLHALFRMDGQRMILLRDPSPTLTGPWQRTGAILRMHKELA